jgi:UDP-MurNAc hydroxylase
MYSGVMVANIQFINHASYILNYGQVRLICDPWLEGSVFDNGWDLLAETRFSYDEFRDVTHIWFSHEHPDHFNPPNLRKIPAEIRSNITVLYQTSLDGKVCNYCRELGFGRVVEMKPDQWLHLGEDLEAHCEPHDNGDSWLAVRSPSLCLLNLNDCVVTSMNECLKISRKVGRVDILTTQFSYANRVANAGDHRAIEAAAREKLSWVKTQALALNPKYVIPFASFSYFSHEDNFYLNDGMNKIGPVAEFIRSKTHAEPIVLYPGDRWNLNDKSPYDSERAILQYTKDYARVKLEGFRHRSHEVEMDTLVEHGKAFIKKIISSNSRLAFMVLPPVTIFLEDHNQALTLSLRSGLQPVSRTRNDCDLVCKSDALDYCFLWEWGGRTLDINGRFQVSEGGQYWKFKTYATLASFNNRGEGLKETLKTVQRRFLKKLGTFRTIGANMSSKREERRSGQS